MPDHIKYLLTFVSTPVFGTCDDETIEQFEASLNVRLPEEYKEFLKVRNGTRFKSLLRFPVSEDYPADSGLWENLAVRHGWQLGA